MAGEQQAGSTTIKVVPEGVVAEWQVEIDKLTAQINASVKVDLKLSRGAVGALVKDTQVALNKRKDLPRLAVKLNIGKGEVRSAVTQANKHIKTLKKKPSINVGLSITQTEVRRAIRDANTRIAAAKTALPKLKVLIDLDENQQKLVNETVVTVKKIDAELKASGAKIDIPVELDEKTLKEIQKKALIAYNAANEQIRIAHQKRLDGLAVLEEEAHQKSLGNLRARAVEAASIDDELRRKLDITRLDRERGLNLRLEEDQQKHLGKINNLVSKSLDARSLEELKHVNRVALLNERAALSQGKSGLTTLRGLRNDLSQFDASTTRILRRLTIGFGLFTTGVVAGFAAITVASLRSFAQTEQQLRRTAAVLGTDTFSKIAADLAQEGASAAEINEKAFAGFRKEVERTNDALATTVNSVAIGTIFDPTEIASGTRALAQAGLEVDQIKASLLGVAQFAQNEEILPEEAVNSLVQGATAAGESLGNLTSLADKFTFVANNTTASAKEIADAFANRSAPQFRSLGQDINDTLTVLDLFAAAGVKGKTAGEQAGILIRFVNDAAAKNTEVFKKNRIEVGKVNGVQVPFLKTLGQLGFLLNSVGKAQGSIARTNLQKQLGLTQKSAAGLNQLLPQIVNGLDGTADSADEAVKGLFNLKAQIEKADVGEGATQRQASVLLDTLSFQTDILANNITTLFKTAAAPLGRALTDVFSKLNGEVKIVNGQVKQVGGVLDDLGKKFLRVGRQIAGVLAPAFERFATGGEGADFFSGIYNGFKLTLRGFVDGFKTFREAAFGEGSNKGFFSVLGDAFEGLGRFAGETLPRIGKGLGILVGFVRENTEVVKGFFRAWAGLFLLSKALRLLIIPLVGLTDNIKALKGAVTGIIELSFVQAIAGWVSGLLGYNATTAIAVAETNALTAAQARLTASQAISALTPSKGIKSASRGAAAADAAAGASAIAPAANAAAASTSKLTRALAGLRAGFSLALKASIAIPIALGAVKGIVDQLNSSMGGDGSVSLQDFKNGLKDVAGAIGAVLGPIFSLVTWMGKVLIGFGQIAGASGVLLVINLFKLLGWVINEGVIKPLVGAIQKMGEFFSWIGKITGIAGPIKDAFGAIGDGFGKIKSVIGGGKDGKGGLLENIGDGFGYLADAQREAYGTTNALSPVFDRVAKALGDEDSKTDALIKKNQKLRDARRKENDERIAQIEKAEKKVRVFGVTEGLAFNASAAWTRGNRALGLTLAQAAQNATVFQQRTANVNLVLKALANRTKFAAQYQVILKNASTDLSTNFDRLTGKKGTLRDLLNTITSGSDKAAKAALRSAIAITRLTEAAQISKATREGTVTNRVIIQQVQAARDQASRSINAFRNEFKNRADELIPEIDMSGIGDFAETAAADTKTAAEKIADAAQLATDAVNKMSAAQFKVAANATIARVLKLPEAYKATAREAAILKAALPAVDAALAKQTAAVTKLDEALSALQSTQLEGTKAANDAAFGFDQQVKALQLQQVDLKIAGATDEDPRIKALNDQIAAIQLQSERASLAAGLALDPLKKKLEETFTPVKELSFANIISQFEALNNQKVVLDARVAKTEGIKARLEQIAGDATEKFKGVGLAVTGGITAGVNAGSASVAKAGKDTANTLLSSTKKTLGIASPSTVYVRVGVDSMQGFVNGINSMKPTINSTAQSIARSTVSILAADQFYIAAGRKVMRGFQTGMNEEYTKKGGVQDFVKEIAVWIKNNKGPISYDAQLLRPAGEAMMSGFHGGLRDGFSEIKGWVKRVGPQLATDTFPKELLVERSAKFLLNNAKADATFTADDAFGDLISDILGGIGPIDPTLSFLHKTLSSADTKEMAQRLVALYPSMNFNPESEQFIRAAGTKTASGNISDHTRGIAADLGTGGPRPTADSLSLFAKLKPLLGTIFKQLIHNGLGLTAGGGTFSDSAHDNHIHAAWLPGEGFDMNSGKKGMGLLNIPGVPADVLQAISAASAKTGLPPALIAAVMKQESGFRKSVVSGDGGYGLMQLTSPGLKAQAGAGLLDPFTNALVGSQYLRDLINQLGSVKLGLSAYNSGPGGGERSGRIDVPNYVNSVMAIFNEYMRKYGGVANFRRQGGNVNANTPTWVGEGGRELWVPDRSGTVISNANIESLIRLAQQGKVGGSDKSITYAPQFDIRSNAVDPKAVADQVDARMRAQIVKVVR
jgi:TP901 family phage tail tape measure protein